MATYRVFQKIDAKDSEKAFGDDIKFVRDSFSVLALLFPAIWLLMNRLWLMLALYIFVLSLFILLGTYYNPVLPLFLNNLLGLYIGFEGRNFIALKLKSLGYREIDILNATNLEEAEARFFQNHTVDFEEDQEEALSENLKKISTGRQALPKKAPLIGGLPTPSRGTHI